MKSEDLNFLFFYWFILRININVDCQQYYVASFEVKSNVLAVMQGKMFVQSRENILVAYCNLTGLKIVVLDLSVGFVIEILR